MDGRSTAQWPHGVAASVGLAALIGHVVARVAIGPTSPVGDRRDLVEVLSRVHESRRLVVFSEWLAVAALMATLVAVAVYLARIDVAGDEPARTRAGLAMSMSGLAVWSASAIVAAAARAQLVRWDFSAVDPDGGEERLALMANNIADYASTFAWMAFAVGMAGLAWAAAEAAGDGVHVARAAWFAGILSLPAVFGAALPGVRDGRFGDNSGFRPGTGVGTLAVIGWAAMLAVLARSTFRRRT